MFYSHRLPLLPEVTSGYHWLPQLPGFQRYIGYVLFPPVTIGYLDVLYSHQLPEVTIGYLVFRGRICFIPTSYLRYMVTGV